MPARRDTAAAAAAAALLALTVLAAAVHPARAQGAATSSLWGTNGELWRATGRLPDLSYAGEPPRGSEQRRLPPPFATRRLPPCTRLARALARRPGLPAGYMGGQAPIPNYPVMYSVKDFGARGDKVTGAMRRPLQ